MRAIPTKTSPYATRCAHKEAWGNTQCSKKYPYQEDTSGWAPDILFIAPPTNPTIAPPEALPVQAGLPSFSHPAESHDQPTNIRTKNQSHEIFGFVNKNFINCIFPISSCFIYVV